MSRGEMRAKYPWNLNTHATHIARPMPSPADANRADIKRKPLKSLNFIVDSLVALRHFVTSL